MARKIDDNAVNTAQMTYAAMMTRPWIRNG
jgi:hypothetical protein